MELRLATHNDFEELQRMTKEFFDASPYKHLVLDANKVDKVITHLLDSDDAVVIVLVEGDTTLGMFAGYLSEMVFSSQKIASEVVWFVKNEARGNKIVFKMIEAFEWWARKRGCTHVHMSLLGDEMGQRLEKIYTRKGYTGSERAFIKSLQDGREL